MFLFFSLANTSVSSRCYDFIRPESNHCLTLPVSHCLESLLLIWDLFPVTLVLRDANTKIDDIVSVPFLGVEESVDNKLMTVVSLATASMAKKRVESLRLILFAGLNLQKFGFYIFLFDKRLNSYWSAQLLIVHVCTTMRSVFFYTLGIMIGQVQCICQEDAFVSFLPWS